MKSLFKEYNGVFDEKVEEPKKKNEGYIFTYSPFAIQDAVGERNVKKVWIEYIKLRLAGIEAEDLIHKIISKTKDMVAINQGVTKEDLGIKDYPFSKSKKDLRNWTIEDLKNFYSGLVEIYHRARMESGNDLSVALERLLLSI